MNAQRRKSIQAIMETIDTAKTDLEGLRDEEQEYFDNMPESLQASEKATTAESAVSSMDTAINSLEDVSSSLEEAQT